MSEIKGGSYHICQSCVSLNAEKARNGVGTLPVLCPAVNKPCLMYNPFKISECIAKHASMSIRDGRFGREPMDGEYIDAGEIKFMKEQYTALPDDKKLHIMF